jgi:hypothetical protein
VVHDLTDPLSAKELVEKTYQYVDRVTKECKKNLVPKLLNEKRGLKENELAAYLATAIEKWFNGRDRLLNIKWDSTNSKIGPRKDVHLYFRGRNKDAKFLINCDSEVYPNPNPNEPNTFYLKTINIYAERSNFEKP